jgi:hypothetical protein
MPTGNLANADRRIKQILRNNNTKLLSFLNNEKRLKLARNLLANMALYEKISKAKSNYNNIPILRRIFRGIRRPKNTNFKKGNYGSVPPTSVRNKIIELHKRLVHLNSGGRSTGPNYSLTNDEKKQLAVFIR